MERPRFPRLVAAAVILQCCARLCPALGAAAAAPCARPGTVTGERCPTGLGPGAGTGRAATPAAEGQLRTEAEPLPFPGTPAGTAKPPSSLGSPRGPQEGGEGTGPRVRDGAATELPGSPLSVGTAGSQRPGPAPAPEEPDTAPVTGTDPGTDPGGNVTAEGATTSQETPSPSPSSVTVPGSAGGQRGSPSSLPGQSPTGTELVQSQGGSRSPSTSEPWAGDSPGATVPLSDSSPGTPLSITLATDSPARGTTAMSPFLGGLQRLLSPTGTLQGTRLGPGLAGGRGSDSRPWHGTDISWQGPHSAPRPSPPSLGAGGHGGPLASTAPPAMGTGPASLPAAGKRSGLLVPTATAGTPGVTSPGPGAALDPTTGVSGPPDTEGPPEFSHVPLDQTWRPPAVPGQPPVPVAPGGTVVAQSRVPHTSPGSPRVPVSLQPVPASGSAVPMSPSLGTSPTAGTPLARPSSGHRLPHGTLGEGPAEPPHIPGGTLVRVGDAEPWAVPALLSTPAAPQPPGQPAPSQPASSLGLTTAVGVTTATATATATAATATATAATATATAATTSPTPLGDVGTVTPEPGAAVLRGEAAGVTWGPPTPLSTVVPGPPMQPTDPSGTPGSPPAAGDTDPVQPSSSPGGWPDADTPRVTLAPAGRAPRVFIVEDQPPLLRVSLLRIPCELVLDTGFVPALQDPTSRERRELLRSFNRTVTPLFSSVPGFLRLEVTGIREGSVVLQYDALFAAERVRVPGLGTLLDAALGSGGARPGLAVGTAPVLRNVALERPLDPCAVLFACPAGFACVSGADGNVTCTSLCHRGYCKNHGICTHPPGHQPLCQCPVGTDFWFMGLRCDYRVTQQSLLGMAAGVLLSIVLLGAAIAAIAVRRFKALLLEARADQTRSSYRRFCRLDDVSAQYWSRSWLPSASSLDNPAFSNSEELLHLQILDNGPCSCREDSGITDSAKHRPAAAARPPCRPSFHYDWDTSSSSMNDPMVDSGKASDISVSSWPMEPIPWTPFPVLHQLSRQRAQKARRPHSYCEGMELGNLERSWTA